MRRALLALALLVGLAAPARADTISYYASPTGSGTACSLASPCTLAQAQTTVRAAVAAGLTRPITVYLRGGTYYLAATLALTSADSGTATKPITWQSYPGERAVLSGLVPVTDWTLYSGSIYRASVGTNWDFRQIYVNGTHVQRARSASFPTGWARSSGGYTLPSSAMASWGNKTDIEVVNFGGWPIVRCKVATIVGTALTMSTPCWTYEAPLISWSSLQDPSPGWVENAYELMASGYWYLDRTAGYLYYWPPSGSMTGVTVQAPNIANPITVTGAAYLTLKNITFDGSNWTGPDSTTGYVGQQSGYTWQSTPGIFGPYPWTDTWGVLMDAAVVVNGGSHVTLDGNAFMHMGSRALLVEGGSANTSITNNTFTDIAGGDLQIGEANNCATAQETAVLVQGNAFLGTQFDYHDNGGVFAVCMANSTITGNEIGHTKWAGLSVGWGWGNVAFTSNNTVRNNWIHDWCEYFDANHSTYFGDCSGFYTNGPQHVRSEPTVSAINYFNITPTAVNKDLFYDLSQAPAAFWTHEANYLGASDGRDIRVTLQDGTTQVPRELLAFNATTHTGYLYMGTSAGTATSLRVYYNDFWATAPTAASSYGANNVWDATLKGVWHMDGASSPLLNSVTGANDLTVSAGATYSVAGIIGNAVGFGGSITAEPSVTLSTDYYSVSMWVKTGATLPDAVFFARGDGTHWDDIGVLSGNWFVHNNVVVTSATLLPPAINTWYHVVYKRVATEVAVYINDTVVIDATSNAHDYTTGALCFGSRFGAVAWPGYIDEVRVWDNYSLSPTEIANLYANQGIPASYTAPALKGTWHLEEASSPMLNSVTGANDMTVSAGATYHATGETGYSLGTGTAVTAEPSVALATDTYSVSMWVKTAGTLPDSVFFSRGAGTGNNWDTIGIYQSQWFHHNGIIIHKGGSPAINTWYHIAYTRIGTDIYVYVNGVLTVTKEGNSNTVNYLTGNLCFGSRWGSIGWPGSIDEIRVWDNYQLSAYDIAYLYANPGTLVGYWATGAEALVSWTPGLTVVGNFFNTDGGIGSLPSCGSIDRGSTWMSWTGNVCQNSPRFVTVGVPQAAASFTGNYAAAVNYNYGGDAIVLAPNTTITDAVQPVGTPQQSIVLQSGSGCNSPGAKTTWPNWQCQTGSNAQAVWP